MHGTFHNPNNLEDKQPVASHGLWHESKHNYTMSNKKGFRFEPHMLGLGLEKEAGELVVWLDSDEAPGWEQDFGG